MSFYLMFFSFLSMSLLSVWAAEHEPTQGVTTTPPAYQEVLTLLNCSIAGSAGLYTFAVPPMKGGDPKKVQFNMPIRRGAVEFELQNSLMAMPVDLLGFKRGYEEHDRLMYWYSKFVWGQRIVRGTGFIAALLLLLVNNDVDNAFRVEIFLGMFSTLANIGIKRMESLQQGIIEERQKIDGRLSELINQYDQLPALKESFKKLMLEFFGYETRDDWFRKLPRTYSAAGIKKEGPQGVLFKSTSPDKNPYDVRVNGRIVSFSHRSPYTFKFSDAVATEAALNVLRVFEEHDEYRNSKIFYKKLSHYTETVETFVDLMGVVIGGVVYLMHDYFWSLMITMGSHLFCLVTELLNTVVFEGRLEKVTHSRKKVDASCSSILAKHVESVRKELMAVIKAVTRYPDETMKWKLPLTVECVGGSEFGQIAGEKR